MLAGEAGQHWSRRTSCFLKTCVGLEGNFNKRCHSEEIYPEESAVRDDTNADSSTALPTFVGMLARSDMPFEFVWCSYERCADATRGTPCKSFLI